MAAPMIMSRFWPNKVRLFHFCLTRSVRTGASVLSDKLSSSEPSSATAVEQEDQPTTSKSDGIEVVPDRVRNEAESVQQKTEKLATDSSGLTKAFEMFRRVERGEDLKLTDEEKKYEGRPLTSQVKKPHPRDEQSFVTMLRTSKLVQLGDPEGRVVVGTIVETMADDLYVDFGGKFDCVCKRPKARASEYKKGAKVRIRLIDLELSSLFMGASRDITLLEADGTLLGLCQASETRESELVKPMEEK